MSSVSIYPAWRQAVKEFLALSPQPGFIIKKAWLIDQFGLNEGETKEQYQKFQLDYLQDIDLFKRELLEIHQIALASVHGEGYRVLAPSEQTGHAMKQGLKRVRSNLRNMGSMLANVDFSRLTADERQQNSDAIARVSMIAGMVPRSKKLVADINKGIESK